jgi:hypothetical protein
MKRLLDLQLLAAWALAIPASYLAVGFLGNHHAAFAWVMLIAFITCIVCGWWFHGVFGRARTLWSIRSQDLAIAGVLFAVLFVFAISMFRTATQFPSLFQPVLLLPDEGQIIAFILGCILAFPALSWIWMRSGETAAFTSGVSEGLLLAGLFLLIYLIPASIFNQPAFDVDDIFFDTDGLLWRTRFTTPQFQDYYWRSVHPYVLLLIRPLVAVLSFFLGGDRLAAGFLLAAGAGATCVFLAWFFIKRQTANSLYAMLIASLLGASAAHLVFSSLIETYIFLAAVMLTFLVLLILNAPFYALVLAGLASFGITLTNFVQPVIAMIAVKRDLKQWIKYGLIVMAFVIPLSLLNNLIYPGSQPYFFIPSTFTAEAENTFVPSIARGTAILRVMFLHSMVAPDPLILQEEIPFLKVWIFKADPLMISEYRTATGTALVIFWACLLLIGFHQFVRNLKVGENRFELSFLLILLFNFLLHLRYGKDLFLYSTNWTYALVFFLGLSWRQLADKRWFQFVLLFFTGVLLANNGRLIHTMMMTAAQHIK